MPSPAFTPTAFARSLTAHACAWRRGYDGSAHPLFATWSDGIHPAFRDAAISVVASDGVRLHKYASAVTSSQAFALNLFLPFRDGDRAALSARLSELVHLAFTIDRITFEWIPPGALLGEIDGERARVGEHATAVDVVLWGRLPGEDRTALLLEVKLGEGGFTLCKGRDSSSNHRKDVCSSAALFFDDPTTAIFNIRMARLATGGIGPSSPTPMGRWLPHFQAPRARDRAPLPEIRSSRCGISPLPAGWSKTASSRPRPSVCARTTTTPTWLSIGRRGVACSREPGWRHWSPHP
jgi:hypothetical protein